jgi:hypothetical protein
MIHVYLVSIGEHNWLDHHGERFQAEGRRLKQETNIDISILAPFGHEAMYYFLHEWRCNGGSSFEWSGLESSIARLPSCSGPCRNKPPRYGYVRLKRHRPPGPCESIRTPSNQSPCILHSRGRLFQATLASSGGTSCISASAAASSSRCGTHTTHGQSHHSPSTTTTTVERRMRTHVLSHLPYLFLVVNKSSIRYATKALLDSSAIDDGPQ